jgi:hypothetical protein
MLRLAFPLLIVCTAAHGFQQDSRPTDSEREKDVYAIYSLMLTNLQTSHGPYISDQYLIAMTIGPGHPQEPCVRPPKERQADFKEVLADFERRKATPPRELKESFSISKPYMLLRPSCAVPASARRYSICADRLPAGRLRANPARGRAARRTDR